MAWVFIGATVMVGLLIGFVTLAIVLISQKVSVSIRDKASSLISTYDEIIRDRSEMLNELNNGIDNLLEIRNTLSEEIQLAKNYRTSDNSVESTPLSPTVLLNAAEQLGVSEYTPSHTGDIYQRIRQGFDRSPYDIIRELVPDIDSDSDAACLFDGLDYDLVYKLSVMPEENQLDILNDALNPEELAIVNSFMENRKHFQIIEFYDWLKEQREKEPHRIKLRISPNERNRAYPGKVEVFVDPEILEGFQIEVNNRVYDYCVKKREIG